MKHLAIIISFLFCHYCYAQHYQNFKVSVYCRAYEVRQMGDTFEKVDKFLGQLGNPIGIKSYKPYHSLGEDFLQIE